MARKRGYFRQFVRRAIPETAGLERRATRLLDAYEPKMGGDGHLVLTEEAVACFKEQLNRARNGCVIDPDWGSYVRSAEYTFRGDGGAVSFPMWKAIRGASRIECFHPTHAGTISGTNFGPGIGNAQLLEAATRRNRKIGRRTAAHADVQRGDVLRGMAALRQKLRGGAQLPAKFDAAFHLSAGEFGVGYRLEGLGADLGAKTVVGWGADGVSAHAEGSGGGLPIEVLDTVPIRQNAGDAPII